MPEMLIGRNRQGAVLAELRRFLHFLVSLQPIHPPCGWQRLAGSAAYRCALAQVGALVDSLRPAHFRLRRLGSPKRQPRPPSGAVLAELACFLTFRVALQPVARVTAGQASSVDLASFLAVQIASLWFTDRQGTDQRSRSGKLQVESNLTPEYTIIKIKLRADRSSAVGYWQSGWL